MAKRKMVQINLIKNSIAAYFAAIELHNKPNIPYRYETVTLLMMNAWELALKAYIKKYIRNRSIYTSGGHTISIDTALDYVNERINSEKKNSFTAVKMNIAQIENYRNQITHFYCDQLEPYIFTLVARSALNYVDFIKTNFSKDIMQDEGLFILPLGFKLPFRPEEFLSSKAAQYATSPETKKFIQGIVRVIKDLKDIGIEDSIVLGFDIYFESVKKASNSDILAAITNDDADVSFTKVTRARFTNDPSAQVFNMSDQEFRGIWKHTHSDLVTWCKENIDGFKQGKEFIAAKKKLRSDINCVYTRKLDSKNIRSASQDFFTDFALEQVKKAYEEEQQRVFE